MRYCIRNQGTQQGLADVGASRTSGYRAGGKRDYYANLSEYTTWKTLPDSFRGYDSILCSGVALWGLFQNAFSSRIPRKDKLFVRQSIQSAKHTMDIQDAWESFSFFTTFFQGQLKSENEYNYATFIIRCRQTMNIHRLHSSVAPLTSYTEK